MTGFGRSDFDFDRLERYLAGELSPTEHDAYTHWIAEDPARRRIVEAVATVGERRLVGEPQWNIDAMRARAHFAMGVRPGNAPQGHQEFSKPRASEFLFPRRLPAWRAGGIVFAVCLLAAGVLWRTEAKSWDNRLVQTKEYITRAGEQLAVTLDDGTHLTLAPASRVRIPRDYAKGHRTVILDGEAFFTVEHDASHPFTVRTASAVIQDVGTAFDVSAYAPNLPTRIAVAEGRVAIMHIDPVYDQMTRPSLPAVAGDVVTIGQGGLSVLHATDVSAITSWTSGELRLTDTPMPEALAALDRWYNLDIQLSDSAMNATHLTGRFRQESSSQVVTALGALLRARAEQHGRVVTLYPLSSRS